MPLERPTLTKQAERGIRDGSSSLMRRSLNEVGDTRKVWFDWSERTDALKRFVGWSDFEFDENDWPTNLMRVAPLTHPDSGFLYVTKFNQINGHKVTGSGIPLDETIAATYSRIDVELGYERLPYNALSDDDVEWDGNEWTRFTSIGEWQGVADNITLPSGAIRFIPESAIAGFPKPIQYNVGIKVPTFEVPITWHRLPRALWNEDNPNYWMERITGTEEEYSYLGTINKSEFKGFPAGTLLLVSVKPVYKPAPIDLPDTWVNILPFPQEIDILFQCHFNPMGWNYLYNHDISGTTTGGNSGWYFAGRGTSYYSPGAVPDDYSMFNEREFRDLWNVGA